MKVYRKPGSAAGPARNRDRWATSYADFVTILLVLFIAIAAQGMQSAMVAASAAPVATAKPAAVAVAMPPVQPAYIAALERLLKKGVRVKVEPRGVVVSLEQKILFDSGNDQVSESALPVIGEIAEVLRGIPNKINLVGHADSRPIHSKRFRDNWELSVARSLRLRELLSADLGIDEMRLSVASFGATEPVDSEETEEGRANNRRVEFVILDRGK